VVITDPRTSERRRVKEAWIRVVDMVVYLFALAGGVFALLVPPNTIKTQLEGWEWLAIAWGCMLVIAGAFGFIGRLTRIWLIEAPGSGTRDRRGPGVRADPRRDCVLVNDSLGGLLHRGDRHARAVAPIPRAANLYHRPWSANAG
jgi:hypothetical protein